MLSMHFLKTEHLDDVSWFEIFQMSFDTRTLALASVRGASPLVEACALGCMSLRICLHDQAWHRAPNEAQHHFRRPGRKQGGFWWQKWHQATGVFKIRAFGDKCSNHTRNAMVSRQDSVRRTPSMPRDTTTPDPKSFAVVCICKVRDTRAKCCTRALERILTICEAQRSQES